jgi:hypothetical protein
MFELKNIYLFVFALILFFACKRNEINIQKIRKCNQAQNLDSSAIHDKLIGTWKWDKQACFSSNKTKKADKNIQVTFNTNATFYVKENEQVITEGNWEIVVEDRTKWGLKLSQATPYFYGAILFCKQQVLFNDSYRDGCDNLFIKSN